MSAETYAKARERLLREAEAAGLQVQRRGKIAPWAPLKAPRITFGDNTVELRAQSVHFVGGDQLSCWIDMRGATLAALARAAGGSNERR